MATKRPSKKTAAPRHAPYILNPLPGQIAAYSSDWRRQHATGIETEILKPESLLPVTTGAAGRSPICFTIKGVPNMRVDGSNIYIQTECSLQKLVGSEWSDIGKDDEVIPLANAYCSMFEDLTVTINGVLAENSQRDFAISSFFTKCPVHDRTGS